jgi:hypothetical protein
VSFVAWNGRETRGQGKRGEGEWGRGKGERGLRVAPKVTLLTQHKNKEEPCESAPRPSLNTSFFARSEEGKPSGQLHRDQESHCYAEGRQPPFSEE